MRTEFLHPLWAWVAPQGPAVVVRVSLSAGPGEPDGLGSKGHLDPGRWGVGEPGTSPLQGRGPCSIHGVGPGSVWEAEPAAPPLLMGHRARGAGRSWMLSAPRCPSGPNASPGRPANRRSATATGTGRPQPGGRCDRPAALRGRGAAALVSSSWTPAPLPLQSLTRSLVNLAGVAAPVGRSGRSAWITRGICGSRGPSESEPRLPQEPPRRLPRPQRDTPLAQVCAGCSQQP